MVKCSEFDYHFVLEKAGVKVQLDGRIQNEKNIIHLIFCVSFYIILIISHHAFFFLNMLKTESLCLYYINKCSTREPLYRQR